MLYTVQEASKILNISRVTIYKKIDTVKELRPFVKVKNNTKFIDENGLEIIRQSTINNNTCKEFTDSEQEQEETKKENPYNSSRVNEFTELHEVLKNQVADLQEQLKAKDRQIQALETVIQQNQILFLNSQKALESKEQKERRTFLEWIGIKK